MKQLSIFTLFCCIVFVVSAQIPAPKLRWAVPISGCTEIHQMQAMPNGDCYVIGTFRDTICYDTTGLHCGNGMGPHNAIYHFFVAKYDKNGSFLWGKEIGNNATNEKNGVKPLACIDEEGAVYFARSVLGDTLHIGDTLCVSPEVRNNAHLYFFKLNSAGKIAWIKQWAKGGNVRDMVYNKGSIYLVVNYTEDFAFGGMVFQYTSGGWNNTAISKMTKEGNILGYQRWITASYDEKLIALNTQELVLRGFFRDSLNLGDTTFYQQTQIPGTGTNNFLIKLKADLSFDWGERYLKSFGWDYDKFIPYENDFYFGGSIPQKEVFLGDSIDTGNLLARVTATGKKKWAKWSDRAYYLNKGKSDFYTGIGCDSTAANPTAITHFFDTLIVGNCKKCSYWIRCDSNMNIVWSRFMTSQAPNTPDYNQVGFVPMTMDNTGCLYGWGGGSNEIHYFDSVKISHLFYFWDKFNRFVFATYPDSFPPKPPIPPVIDTFATHWNVYPNPYQQSFSVSGTFEQGVLILKLIDMSGREVQQRMFNLPAQHNTQYELAFPNLAEGVYILYIENGNKRQYLKLIKRS